VPESPNRHQLSGAAGNEQDAQRPEDSFEWEVGTLPEEIGQQQWNREIRKGYY
jgi:hypothetical protein